MLQWRWQNMQSIPPSWSSWSVIVSWVLIRPRLDRLQEWQAQLHLYSLSKDASHRRKPINMLTQWWDLIGIIHYRHVWQDLSCSLCAYRSSEFAAAKESFDRSYKRQEEILAKIDSKSLIQALGRKASEADEEAEALYQKFMGGELTVEAFVPAYTQRKKLYHQRELKTQAAQQIFWSDSRWYSVQ